MAVIERTSLKGIASRRSPAWMAGLFALVSLLALPWGRTERSLLEFDSKPSSWC